MKELDHFLQQMSVICQKYQMLAETEEKFNIFQALHKMHDERRLHSRFISVLLQPKGTHGFGSQFLKLFLEEFQKPYEGEASQIEDHEINDPRPNDGFLYFQYTDDCIVFPKEFDKKEHENIDILIIDSKQQQCIIIENKIYAGDSNGGGGNQLQRYIDYAHKERNIPLEKIDVIYLTLDGHEPSENSVGSYIGVIEIILASYENNIKNWLERCLTLTARFPFLRESIMQYIKLINKMTTDNTSVEERKEYRSLIGSSEGNMMAAKKLYQNFKHVKWHSVQEFWVRFQSKIQENGYKITNPVVLEDGNSVVITELTHYEDYRKGQRKKQICRLNFKLKDGLEIAVRYNPDSSFYFGISKTSEVDHKHQENAKRLIAKHPGKYKETKWMYLHKRFDRNIPFNDFNQDLAFQLINSVQNRKLVEETWAEIDELIGEL